MTSNRLPAEPLCPSATAQFALIAEGPVSLTGGGFGVKTPPNTRLLCAWFPPMVLNGQQFYTESEVIRAIVKDDIQ